MTEACEETAHRRSKVTTVIAMLVGCGALRRVDCAAARRRRDRRRRSAPIALPMRDRRAVHARATPAQQQS